MQIRPFQIEDEPAVIVLWRDVFGYPAPHNDPAFVIRQKLQTQPDLFFVASDGQKVLGTVMGGYDGHRGWIYSLAVAPDCRGRGIGSMLMKHVESALKQLGCPKINLQVLAGNAEVVDFYKRFGYAVEERINLGKIL